MNPTPKPSVTIPTISAIATIPGLPAGHTISTCNTAAATGSSALPTGVKQASPRQIQEWLRSGAAILIDVREPEEHAREKIAAAQLVPLSRFDPWQAAAGIKPGQRLVLHCKGGTRSSDACRMAASLSASGITVINMTGGINAWKRENLPVEVNTKVLSISVMRQVQLVIGLGVLAGSALAWFIDPRFIAIPAFFGSGLTFAGASGTCGLASLIGAMPWNKTVPAGVSCSTGNCA